MKWENSTENKVGAIVWVEEESLMNIIELKSEDVSAWIWRNILVTSNKELGIVTSPV